MAEAVDADMAALLSACTVCRPWAEQDEGPYHRDRQPERRDVTEDREGVPVELGIRLARVGGEAVVDGVVEIWQCDALGRYSGFPPPNDGSVVTAATAPRGTYLEDQTFLRGRQRTDRNGMVELRTIHPGWYPGRTVHIHLMVHTGDRRFTSQLYFPEDVNEVVLAKPPYAERPGRDTFNDTDGIFSTGGEPAVLDVHQTGNGYRAGICLVLPPTNGPS